MGGGSKTSAQPTPPPTPTPDGDGATQAAEMALAGKTVASYGSTTEDEKKKQDMGSLGATSRSAQVQQKKHRAPAAMMGGTTQTIGQSAVLTG